MPHALLSLTPCAADSADNASRAKQGFISHDSDGAKRAKTARNAGQLQQHMLSRIRADEAPCFHFRMPPVPLSFSSREAPVVIIESRRELTQLGTDTRRRWHDRMTRRISPARRLTIRSFSLRLQAATMRSDAGVLAAIIYAAMRYAHVTACRLSLESHARLLLAHRRHGRQATGDT